MKSFQGDLNWQEMDTWKWKAPTGHGSVRDLDQEECEVARKVFEEIKEKSEIFFRGEKINNLARRYSGPGNSASKKQDYGKKLVKISEALFFFGEKGKHFWDDSILKPKAIKLLKNINDCDGEAIKCLFEIICNTSETEAVMCDYFKRKKRLRNAFERLNVQDKLILELSILDKRKLRDMLIFFLHNYSSNKFRTPFVSMTLDIEVAAGFASTEKNGRCGCVIAGFLPPKWSDRAVKLTDIEGCHEILCRIELPLRLFVNHKHSEVALFGAIFPQYIIWLMDIKNKFIFWNPRIFEVDEEERSEIPTCGIPIDQVDFRKRIGEETAFACGLFRSDENDVEI